MMRWILVIACGLLAGARDLPTAAGAEPPQAPTCIGCRSKGRLPCKEHEREARAWEDEVLYCSVAGSCEACGGTAWIDCAKCENDPVQKDLERRRARIPRSRETLAKLDQEMRRSLRKAESQHFVLVWEMTGMKVEKRRLDEHELLHLMLRRLEGLHAEYRLLLGAREGEFARKPRVFVWYLPAEQSEASLRFCGQSDPASVKLMGADPNYSVCGNKQVFNSYEALERNVVHCAVHLLLSSQAPVAWLGQIKGGWADEGLAHWFETRYYGLLDIYCFEEQLTLANARPQRFKPDTRKLVASGALPSAAEVMQKNTDQLQHAEHAQATSLVDYLLFLDGEKLNHLLKRLRAREELREALQKTFGFSLLELDQRWKAWVLETYPVRQQEE